MRRPARKTVQRTWYVALMVTCALFGSFFAGIGAQADSSTTSTIYPPENGQTWWWDRPAPIQRPEGAPPEFDLIGDAFGANTKEKFAPEHLYVGWDPAGGTGGTGESAKREMISGIRFDLLDSGLPFGAIIVKFQLTLLEHRVPPDPTQCSITTETRTPPSSCHGVVNQAQARVQGIVACAWPEFIAGSQISAASPISEAPRGGGDCGRHKVSGTSTSTVNADGLSAWKFDLTDMMSDLWSSDENTSLSLEPNIDAISQNKSTSWITAFHNGLSTEANADGQIVPRPGGPGVIALVEWLPPSEVIDTSNENNGNNEEFFEEFTTTTGDSGGDSDGGFIDDQASNSDTGAIDESGNSAPSSGTSGTTPRRASGVAGVFEAPAAKFWDIPFSGWLAALIALAILMGSGWLLSGDWQLTRRSAGAVGKLMEGRQIYQNGNYLRSKL